MFARSALRPLRNVSGIRNLAAAALYRPTVSTVIHQKPSTIQMRYNSNTNVTEIPGQTTHSTNMTFKEVETRVLKAIQSWDRFPQNRLAEFTLDVAFEEMGFDSLDKIEAIMSVEDEFGFEITVAESEKFKSPRDIFKFICEHENVCT